MSGIDPLQSVSEYAPNRYDDKKELTVAKEEFDDQTKAPVVQTAAEHQDKKTTTQGFQYTGKGSFIDGIF
ncbi:hypothetical protein [uncultured Pseudodesulfovibrio sp.]|uniref:hypothetical protein n=1 Tax=uncultured Pseudodesulfovibrio sp. TaxID=2035858 RepID=UPI0029C7C84E|nr:hypothetical protein [uncultured Pseudodesulfovibrio sp.]